ncbi:hypothetical protein A2U01_0116650, partial [Trifolium medium]|nr:hypothetical protein [Trifolium medium]
MNSVLRLAWNLPSWAQQPAGTRKNRVQTAPGLVLPKLGAVASKCR